MPPKFKAPKDYPKSEDLEDRRRNTIGDTQGQVWFDFEKDVNRQEALKHSTSNEGFMKEVGERGLATQRQHMAQTASNEAYIQRQHDAARVKRRASTTKKFPGVK